MAPRWSLLIAVVLLALWIILAFVAAIPSGWVHAPLAAATIFIAKGIIDSK